MGQKVKEKSMDGSTYGHNAVFGLEDDAVNPLVVKYLADVRNEANATLITSFVKNEEPQTLKHSADMYDDEPVQDVSHSREATPTSDRFSQGNLGRDELVVSIEPRPSSLHNVERNLPARLQLFNANLPIWGAWYNTTRDTLLSKGFTTQEYSSQILDLLLYHIKVYLHGSAEPVTGIRAHLCNLLKNHKVEDDLLKENTWVIDEEWIIPTLSRLDSVRLRDIGDIKRCLTGDYRDKRPRNYQQWTEFMKDNEPTASMFSTMVGIDDIWIILKFMKVNWIKQIAKDMSSHTSRTLAMWLLYSLLYLPKNLPASDISTIRDFSKKCRKLYLDKQVPTAHSNPSIFHTQLSKELKGLGITSPDPDMSMLEMVIIVASSVFGQQDLVLWDGLDVEETI